MPCSMRVMQESARLGYIPRRNVGERRMTVLHCIETQGLRGAQDTVNCTLVHGGETLLALLFAALLAILVLLVMLLVVVLRRKHHKPA